MLFLKLSLIDFIDLKRVKNMNLNIIGIYIETNYNQALNDLRHLWEKFYCENIFAQIPNKLADDVYYIY